MMRSRSLLTLQWLAACVAACDEVIIPARDETTVESGAGRGDWIRTSDSCVPNSGPKIVTIIYQRLTQADSAQSWPKRTGKACFGLEVATKWLRCKKRIPERSRLSSDSETAGYGPKVDSRASRQRSSEAAVRELSREACARWTSPPLHGVRRNLPFAESPETYNPAEVRPSLLLLVMLFCSG